MNNNFDNAGFETLEAQSVKVVYTNETASETLNEKILDLDYKIYKNKFHYSRNNINVLPKVKTKRLDDKVYRGSKKTNTSLIKDFENHKIEKFAFVSLAS